MSEELKAAQARIACLEGEIAKRDEELAACRVAVENCEVFRVRIAELEAKTRTAMGVGSGSGNLLVYGNYDSIKAAQKIVIERDQLRTELSALKAQEPVIDAPYGGILRIEAGNLPDSWVRINPCKLYAAPVSEAKAHGNYAPASVVWIDAHHVIEGNNPSFIKDVALVSAERTSETQIPLARLCAATVLEVNAHCTVIPEPYGWVAAGSFYTDRESAICAAEKTPCIDVYSRPQMNALENRSLQRQELAEELARQLNASCAEIRNMRNLYAAPAAPAADAGMVEALGYQVLFDAIAAATSVYANGAVNISVQAFRESLAAHSAEGVV